MRGDCKVSFIVGKRGSGKTHLARQIVNRTQCSRAVYYDSNGHDYSDGVICDGLAVLKDYWRRVVDTAYRLIFRSVQPRKDFDLVCNLVMAAGDTVFIVDEVDMFFDKGEPSDAFGDVIRRGRHNDIELIGITQRPRQMGELRSMANTIYIFETHEPSDLQYFKQAFSEKLIEKIKQLKQYEYVIVNLPYDEEAIEICRESDEPERGFKVHQQPAFGVSVGLRSQNSDSPGKGE